MNTAMCGQVLHKPVRTFVFLGDSITDCGHLWDDDPRCLGQGYVREIADALSHPSCCLINLGQDGFTSADVLRLLQRDGLPRQKDCISLLIGINDLSVGYYADSSWIPDRFAANIRKILSLIRHSHGGKLIIMEPFLFPFPAEHRRLFPLLIRERQILQAAAGQYDGLYLPLQNALNEAASGQGERQITPDGIHLTGAGNRIVAAEWLKAYSAAFFS